MKIKLLLLFPLVLLYFVHCSTGPADYVYQKPFTFCIVNVGQGLSQIGTVDDTALVFDMGLPECREEWLRVYKSMGAPFISSIIISHDDLDHCGGLQFIDSTVRWSGEIGVNKYADTNRLKSLIENYSHSLHFTTIMRGDSISVLKGISVVCLWPPESLLVQNLPKNDHSSLFSLIHNNNRILITSDIDSTVESQIIDQDHAELSSSIMVVPHHGSSGSYNENFFSLVDPDIAIISCSSDNPYGHPSEPILLLLQQLNSQVFTTYLSGTISFTSNGYYWVKN